MRAGRELPALVELPVIREVRFGRDAENPATVYGDRAVQQLLLDLERRTDDEHRRQRVTRAA